MVQPRYALRVIGIIGIGLTSCSEEKVRTYRVAVDDSGEIPSVPEQTASPRPVRWQPPEGWQEETPGQFQTSLYRLAPGIQVSVSMLPGDGGGMAANVNRWRRQIGLEPVAEIGGETIPLEDGEAPAKLFELRGAEQGILAAIVPLDRQTWFFKLNAPAKELETRRAEFMTLLESIQIGTATANQEVTPAKKPDQPGKPGIGLTVPDGWEKSEGSSMRVASFRIPGNDDLEGDVSVIPLLGGGGTTLDNVNRWRAQLRLPALASEDDPAIGKTVDGSSGPMVITHIVSDKALLGGDRKSAISTAILRAGDVTWFFKLSGDAGLVRENREQFEAFVLSAVLP